MDVSVIIVSFNTKFFLDKCIASIFSWTEGVDFEIIVVDNNSTDGSKEMIKSKYPQCLLIDLPTNVGFGRANNVGSRHAKGKYLFFLNSDAELIENSIHSFFSFMEERSDSVIAAVGGNIVFPDLAPQNSHGNYPSLYSFMFGALGLNLLFPKFYLSRFALGKPCFYEERAFIVPHIVGVAMFIASKPFGLVGGFDEDFFLYLEETDLCFRLKHAGFEIYILPSTKIKHYLSKSMSHVAFKYIEFEKSRLLYFKKRGVRPLFLIRLLIAISLFRYFVIVRERSLLVAAKRMLI